MPGATGTVGRHIVDVLEARGHDIVAISRSGGVDVISGEGLAEALVGVDAVIDAVNSPSPDEQAATEFFSTAARNLQEVGGRAGVQRIVVVSIIGIDQFATGYYPAKVAHERAMLEGEIPVQILRAAQFHEFAGQVVEWGRRGEVSEVPKMRTQPVAARTVAEALADLATNGTSVFKSSEVRTLEIAGPREESLVEMARLLASSRGDPVRIDGVDDPDDPDRLMQTGALLPGPDATLTGPTFEQWLDSEVTL